MKKLITLVVLLAASLIAVGQNAAPPAGPAYAGGSYNTANYIYHAQVYTGGGTAGTTYAITVFPSTVVIQGRTVGVFSTTSRITIGQGASQETVTPTTVSGCGIGQPYRGCTITAAFTYSHGKGDQITSGSAGLDEALNDAANTNGSVVISPGLPTITDANIAASTAIFPNVTIKDQRKGEQTWTVQPSTLTALATPATRSATAGNTQVISGTATATWAAVPYYVCVTYVDILGGESPCSASYNFTATVNVALNYASPAASTGAVGWRAYAGVTGTSTMYQLPITSANCTLSTLTPYNTCAIGAAGVFTTPVTTTALAPAAGGVAATYRPNTQSHTTFAYAPVGARSLVGMQSNYGPFLASPALTAGQSVVVGTVPLPTGSLNFIGRTIRITGKISATFSTGGSIQLIVGLGDTTDFSTGTPKAICTLTSTGALTTVAYGAQFQCDLTTNAVGATGSLMPDGFSIVQVQGGSTTAAEVTVESATAAITADVLNPSTLNIEFLQTSAAESTTPPQLLTLHVEVL
jgi:hypothetical protein